MNNVRVTRKQVEDALPKLEQLAKETLEKTGVPGMAITVVYQDEVLYLQGFGVRKVGEHQPVDADERLYQRLGMKHTSSRFADYEAANNRAFLHVLVDGTWFARYTRDPDTESPAGGVSSTMRDLAQWVRLQLGNGTFEGQPVIAADALAETHRPQIVSRPPDTPATDRASLYGLGWGVGYDEQGRVRLSHSGAFNLGAATTVALLPAEGLGIVVLTNAHPIGMPEAISTSFFELVLNGEVEKNWVEIYGKLFPTLFPPDYGTAVDYTKPPAHPSPALSFDAYVGTYHNDFYGEIEIAAQDGGLVLKQGAKQDMFPLTHFDRDVFTYQPIGENAYGLSGVTFTIGADGKATSVVVENLDVYRQGPFTRVPGKQ